MTAALTTIVGCLGSEEQLAQGIVNGQDALEVDVADAPVPPARAAPNAVDEPVRAMGPLRRFSKTRPETLDARNVYSGEIVVKFVEGSRLTARTGRVQVAAEQRAIEDDERLQAFGVSPNNRETEIARLQSVLSRWPNARIGALLPSDPRRDARRIAGEIAVRHRLPDLETYAAVQLPNADLAETQRVIDALAALPIVELVYAAPRTSPPHRAPCTDWAPATTNFDPLAFFQDTPPSAVYLGAGLLVSGHDARFSRTVPGGTGAGASVIDVEGGFLYDHEDLPQINTIAGWNIYEQDHGAATLGVIAGCNNNYGITGLAYAANVRFASPHYSNGWSPWNVAAAISAAHLQMTRGDVLVVEQQGSRVGFGSLAECRVRDPNLDPNNIVSIICDGNWAPMEYWGAEFDAIKSAAADGIVVVEAAGNGGMNLDMLGVTRQFEWSPYNSGAIMVAAATPEADNRAAHWTAVDSNAGPRADLSAWDSRVTTAGFGTLGPANGFGGDPNQRYMNSYSATSAATAIVGASLTSFMGMYVAANGNKGIIPSQVRDFFQRVGFAQVSPWVYQNAAGPTVNHGMVANVFRERTVEGVARGFWPSAPPDSVTTNNNVHLVGVDWNGVLAQNTFRGGAWYGWTQVPLAISGGGNVPGVSWMTAFGAPDAERSEIFARGGDGYLYWTRRVDMLPTANYLAWNATGISAPSARLAVATTASQVDAFGVSVAGALRWFNHPNTGTGILEYAPALPNNNVTLASATPIAVSSTTGRIDVFATSNTGATVHATLFRSGGVSWVGWNTIAAGLSLDHATRLGTDVFVVGHTGVDVQIGRLNNNNNTWSWTSVPVVSAYQAVLVPFEEWLPTNYAKLKLVVELQSGVIKSRTIWASTYVGGAFVGEGVSTAPWTQWASVGWGQSLRVTPHQNRTQLVFALNGNYPMFRLQDALYPTQ